MNRKNMLFGLKRSTHALSSNSSFKLVNSKRSNSHSSSQYDWNRFLSLKRSQEEFVGFAIILILIAVIAVIFLGIMIRQEGGNSINTDASSLLYSMMKQTSGCAINYEPNYQNLEELIKSCGIGGETCLDSRNSCDVIKTEAKNILGKARDSDNRIKGYRFGAYRTSNNSLAGEAVAEVLEGNCTSFTGHDYKIPGEDIQAILDFC